MSKARMVEAAPYLKLPVSAAGGSAFEDVDPVTRDATPGELLDVETATAADFRALPGIGKITAERDRCGSGGTRCFYDTARYRSGSWCF